MPRRLLRRWLPTPHQVRELKALGAVSRLLHDPNLWHLNRRSLSEAAFVGVFVAFIPLPTQMLIAALLAIWLRCNLPCSVALVWLTNPVTMPPIYFGAYLLGARIMGIEAAPDHFDLTWDWILARLEPFLLGCLICGVVLGAVSLVAVRVLWRVAVVMQWRARQRRRAHS
jgi:uncharacterized protein (DUF2062 family)